ncbi:MAG: hypothetical protein JO091_01810, partial [Acidobacteriaceae bacterium]|nr:hypothetical protein [Acidobacteriaceae bacterium]
MAAYTLSTMDGGEVAPLAISAVALVLAALYFGISWREQFTGNVPAFCLLFMAAWGVLQTWLSPQKISYNGWSAVLFWMTASAIVLLAA